MIPLNEVDLDRVKKVKNGDIWGRGSGKTTAKLIGLLYYLRPENDGKQYLYIGENPTHTRDICRTFAQWVHECGVKPTISMNPMQVIAEFPPVIHEANSFLDKLFSIIEEPKKPAKVRFRFTCPSLLNPVTMRGIRYNKIIIDLTYEKQRQYRREMEEALIMENIS
jgi:hypothetical protein